jgi:hypothetical protein
LPENVTISFSVKSEKVSITEVKAGVSAEIETWKNFAG